MRLEKRWIAIPRVSRREDFGFEYTRLARHPEKVVAEEKEQEEDEVKEAEGSDEEDEEYYAFVQATIEQIQIRQTQHSDALADIQATLKYQGSC